MEISKDSWHFKLNDALRPSFEVDVWKGKHFTTCSYIRLTFFTLILATMMAVAGLGLALFALSMIAGMIGAPIALILGMQFESALILNMLGVGMLGWLIALVVGIAFIVTRFVNWIAEWNTKQHHKRKDKASLINQALKDRKDGICTIVTFK